MSRQMACAFAARERDEYAVALLDRRSVLDQHLNFADVRNQAGFCRAMLGDMEGALREVGHAVRVNPDYTEAHLNRASELEARPTDELPVEDGKWRRCLELNPKDQRAIAMLAALERGRGLARGDGEASGAGTEN